MKNSSKHQTNIRHLTWIRHKREHKTVFSSKSKDEAILYYRPIQAQKAPGCCWGS